MTKNEKNIIEKLAASAGLLGGLMESAKAKGYVKTPSEGPRQQIIRKPELRLQRVADKAEAAVGARIRREAGDRQTGAAIRVKNRANEGINALGEARAEKMTGKKEGSEIAFSIVNDLIKGASQNPRLAHIQLDGALAGAGFTQFDIAKTAGMLLALGEAEYSVKEACEALDLNEDTLQAIAVVASR